MVWRLILDRELEHSEATGITDALLAKASLDPVSPTRVPKHRQRSGRLAHHSLGALGGFRDRVAHI